MLPNPKRFVKEHESDIFIIATVILIALASFGAGRLTARDTENEPIIIQNPSSANILQQAQRDAKKETTEQGIVIGSSKSTKYHHPDCVWVQKISLENRIEFASEKEAQKAGYTPCSNFDKYKQ